MRLFKFGKVNIVPSANYKFTYYDVKYVSDLEDNKARSAYVYSLLYDIKEWDLECLPTYIDVEFKCKIDKKFKKKKSSQNKKSSTKN